MSTIVCKNVNCGYRTSSGFCSAELVSLNNFGCCTHWWHPEKPEFRGRMWDYAKAEITEPVEASEHEFPHDEKIAENEEENNMEKSSKSSDF